MCEEHKDSYLNGVSKLNETKTFHYFHNARRGLFYLKQLHVFGRIPPTEPHLTKDEIHRIDMVSRELIDILGSVERRLLGRRG